MLAVVVVCINGTWHFFRAWLPLFLRTRHGYSLPDVSWFSMAYYFSTDAGSLAAGFASLALVRHGLSVHGSRVSVFGFCSVLTILSLLAAALPTGPLLTAVLLVVGFGALGLFPVYYSLSQELTVVHQGKVTGALGCICWLSMALLHEVVGYAVQGSVSAIGGAGGAPTFLLGAGAGSYTLVMSLAGVVPFFGLLVLLLFWGPTGTAASTGSDALDDAPVKYPSSVTIPTGTGSNLEERRLPT